MVRLLLHYQNLMAVMMQTVQMVDRIQIMIKMIPQQIFQFQVQVQESQETVRKFDMFLIKNHLHIVIFDVTVLCRCTFSYCSNAGF